MLTLPVASASNYSIHIKHVMHDVVYRSTNTESLCGMQGHRQKSFSGSWGGGATLWSVVGAFGRAGRGGGMVRHSCLVAYAFFWLGCQKDRQAPMTTQPYEKFRHPRQNQARMTPMTKSGTYDKIQPNSNQTTALEPNNHGFRERTKPFQKPTGCRYYQCECVITGEYCKRALTFKCHKNEWTHTRTCRKAGWWLQR